MDNPDKRRYVRIRSENVVAYSVLKPDGGIDMAHSGYVHSKNISQGGILFVAFENFAPGTLLQMKLRIQTESSKEENIGMVAEVVRNDILASGKKWDVAVYIKYIEHTKLDDFMSWLAGKIGS